MLITIQYNAVVLIQNMTLIFCVPVETAQHLIPLSPNVHNFLSCISATMLTVPLPYVLSYIKAGQSDPYPEYILHSVNALSAKGNESAGAVHVHAKPMQLSSRHQDLPRCYIL